ncbi:exosortase/archaeosortase family protein [Blastococcus haudaquaticus]|uniref:Exosortase/archaeosortase family protein n=1 Tax=Blastococcus haudaquaticus TaxID=1938745 RepID=A0A286GXP0_9ACTN|nr:exosortase/archaeosortase family protein [Blastococcus haudaquaticus]SOE00251.1 exosortase/archaeosortase family protein [Blastococcus haudaquaticus]
MTATVVPREIRGRVVVRGGARRRLVVLVELIVAVSICLVGYRYGATWFKEHEARWTVAILRFFGEERVSAAIPGHILMFRDDGQILDGAVTTSCSSILTVIGLTALTVSVLRKRRWHAVYGLAVGLVAVVIANDLRLIASALAGVHWGQPAMVLFHDWVGTVWTLAATLMGFLIMVWLTLPISERAEQDVAGRHTARRPNSWARPGLGYRTEEQEAGPNARRRTITGLMHRYVLPSRVSRRLAARREAGRIDYRIGHLPPEERAATVRALVADGLGAHIASLLAVATYEEDVTVLDALADAIAARQWEPVTNDRIAAVRLWARGWLFGRRSGRAEAAAEHAGLDDDTQQFAVPPDDDGTLVRSVRAIPPVPVPAPRPVPRQPERPAHPRSFARPAPGTAQTEDVR